MTQPPLGVYWTACQGAAIARAGRVVDVIYKICRTQEWGDAERLGVYRGAGIDLQDGYIHFSTAAQVVETAKRHFSGVSDLVLVAVAAVALGPALKWERSRGGDMFPHLYSALAPEAVLWVKPLPLDADDRHVFPELEP